LDETWYWAEKSSPRCPKIREISLGKGDNMTHIKTISSKELAEIKNRSIKVWHFEKVNGGVKPVEGEYDPENPIHVKRSKVIREHKV
jgi:hypothetical protein